MSATATPNTADNKSESNQEPCKCLSNFDKKIQKEHKLEISPKCKALDMGKSLSFVWGLPLARTDEKPLRRNDPKMVYIKHCPFCGSKLPQAR